MTDIATHVHAIAVAVGSAATNRRTCCRACGCLIFTWESCPACRMNHANQEKP